MATNEDWAAARSAMEEAAFSLQFDRGPEPVKAHLAALSDDALAVAVNLTTKLHYAAMSVMTARKGPQAVLDALMEV